HQEQGTLYYKFSKYFSSVYKGRLIVCGQINVIKGAHICSPQSIHRRTKYRLLNFQLISYRKRQLSWNYILTRYIIVFFKAKRTVWVCIVSDSLKICSLSQYSRTEKLYFFKFNASGDSSASKISCKFTTFFTKGMLMVNTIRCSYGVPTRHSN
ncbi:hypothetical protein HZS_3484, partial [Henneguya salminicola]